MIKVVALVAMLAACGYSRPADVGPKDSTDVDAARPCVDHDDCGAGEACLNEACVTPDQSCPAAQFAQMAGVSGPILYAPSQNDIGGHNVRCAPDARCGSGRVCELEIRFHDPDNDVSQGATVTLYTASGAAITPIETPRIGADSFIFRSCFPEDDSFVGAVQISDDAGHASTPLCFAGSHTYPTCDPLSAAGCATGEKCGWINDRSTPIDGHVGCAPDGTVAAGGACAIGEPGATGYSNCRGGTECVGGRCEAICDQTSSTACGDNVCARTADLFVTSMANIGTCKPLCHPLTQREGTLEACGSTTATNPDQGCYWVGGPQKYTCAPVPNDARGLTDRRPALLVGGNPVANGCEAGWIPFFYQSTTSTTVVCAGTCAPKKTDNTLTANLTGDPAAVAKLPNQPTPQVGNGRCMPNVKGSETGQGCIFSWYFMVDQNGNVPSSAFNDTTGICFAARHYTYDHDGDPGTAPRGIPSCDRLPPGPNPPSGCTCGDGFTCTGPSCPDGLANEWGCYPSTESGLRTAGPRPDGGPTRSIGQLPRRRLNFRLAYGESMLYRHTLQ